MTWTKSSQTGVDRNVTNIGHDLALSYVPRYEKRRILQKNQVGEGIVNGILPLILDTIKSLL